MTTISVCIGSACHKRGSYAILNRFKALAAEKAFPKSHRGTGLLPWRM